jgi:hypothetical protein
VVLVGYGANGEPRSKAEYDPNLIPLKTPRHGPRLCQHTGKRRTGTSLVSFRAKVSQRNAVDDYLKCAEMLLERMEPRRLSPAPFDGRSRGAVAVNHRPKLFGSVVYVNAFLDITTSMANRMGRPATRQGRGGSHQVLLFHDKHSTQYAVSSHVADIALDGILWHFMPRY